MTVRPAPVALALLLVSAAGGPPVSAATSASALASADRTLVDKAAAYLQALKTAQARFSQTDPRGAVTTGTFSLERPGKARFAYDAPTDLTVVADGLNVDVYDGKLKTYDQYPLRQTPLAVLLGSEVRFDKAAVVVGVSHDKGGFTVEVRDAKKQAQGKLSLRFSTGPMALTGWTVLDAQGGKTTVVLTGLRSGVPLASDLFVLRDPNPHTIKP